MGSYVRNRVSADTTETAAAATTIKKTTTSVLTASKVVCEANPKRKGFYIWNNSANSVYLSFEGTASSAGPTKILATFTTWEVINGAIWQGVISGIRNSGSGNIVVWELES
jgi:hypothetical protein